MPISGLASNLAYNLPLMDLKTLESKKISDLRVIAQSLGIDAGSLKKNELITAKYTGHLSPTFRQPYLPTKPAKVEAAAICAATHRKICSSSRPSPMAGNEKINELMANIAPKA